MANKLVDLSRRVYRVLLPENKYEEIVWKHLKEIHTLTEWNYKIHEKEKFIENIFKVNESLVAKFFYILVDGMFHCRVVVMEYLDPDQATDIFVLASHFNNLLNDGVVVVNVNQGYVEYHTKRDYLIGVINPIDIYNQMTRHHTASIDIFEAFKILKNDKTEPAFIMADIMSRHEKSKE
jgi:hypothetical protein